MVLYWVFNFHFYIFCTFCMSIEHLDVLFCEMLFRLCADFSTEIFCYFIYL